MPVHKPSSTYIEAVVSILHHLEDGFVTIDYLDRDNITSFPVFATTRLGSKTGDHMSQRYTLEATVFLLSDFDKLLFGAYDMNIVNLLDEETRVALLGKDCKEVVNYPVYDCQDIVGGENGDIPLYTDCTFAGWVSEVTGTDGVGCGGGNTPPSGPGTGGTSGGGGGSGPTVGTTGPGVIIITIDPNDPNNRCIEDGVGCDEEEEEEDVIVQSDSIRFDTSLTVHPCADDVINTWMAGIENDLNRILVELFGPSSSLHLNYSGDYLRIGLAGYSSPIGDGQGGFLTARITINDRPGYIDCSKDHIFSTLVHEALHAYITYQFELQGQDSLNSIYGFIATQSASTNDGQHEVMATAYVHKLARLINDFNPSLDYQHCVDLAWSGLEYTNVFRTGAIAIWP